MSFHFGGNTISGTFSKHIWTLQIEINKKITAYKENKDRLELLLNILEEWIKQIKENSITLLE